MASFCRWLREKAAEVLPGRSGAAISLSGDRETGRYFSPPGVEAQSWESGGGGDGGGGKKKCEAVVEVVHGRKGEEECLN